MIIDTLKLLKVVMENPLSRSVLQTGLKPRRDGRTRELEHALAIFAGRDRPHDLSCHVYSLMVATILKAGGASFNVNFEHLRNYLRDPIVRRGVTSAFRHREARRNETPSF